MSTNPPSKSRRASQKDAALIAEEASLWLARRDRGLTPAEQDAYMQWLTADPSHAEVLARHAAAFERMMQLYDWQPGQSANVNPDLFAPAVTRLWWRRVISLAAAAAAILLVGTSLWREINPAVSPPMAKSYLRINERKALPDGSVVELKYGSKIVVEFSAAERRVQLTGEAYFKVAKNSVPFVVVAGGVALRAVGTEFNVRLDADAVEVLVTEGKVSMARVSEPGLADRLESPESGSYASRALQLVVAGQRGIVQLALDAGPQVTEVSPVEVKSLLAWQISRLQFFETPLAVAIEEFNRRNLTRLVIADRELGAIPIGGTFRADNPDGFAHVLELTLEIKAVRHEGNQILLTRSR